MFFDKEEKVYDLLKEHADMVLKSVHHLNSSLEYFFAGNDDKVFMLAEKVAKAETKADAILKEINTELYKGAHLPAVREDFIELAELFDDIADNAENVSDFISYQNPRIPEKWHEDYLHVMERTLEATEELKKTFELLFSKMEEAFDYSENVKDIEDDIDELEDEIILQIFQSDLSLAEKMHYRDFVIRIGFISNTAENASDKIQAFTLKGML